MLKIPRLAQVIHGNGCILRQAGFFFAKTKQRGKGVSCGTRLDGIKKTLGQTVRPEAVDYVLPSSRLHTSISSALLANHVIRGHK